MKLTTAKIGSVSIDIEVNAGGTFTANYNDNDYEAKTSDELYEKLRAAVKKAQQQGTVDVSVLGLVPTEKKSPFGRTEPYQQGIGVVHAKLRAKHERHYQTHLLVSEEKKNFQVNGYDRSGIVTRRLSQTDVDYYVALREKVKAAEQELQTFVDSVKIDPDKALEAARAK
jgi:hypothetical protein